MTPEELINEFDRRRVQNREQAVTWLVEELQKRRRPPDWEAQCARAIQAEADASNAKVRLFLEFEVDTSEANELHRRYATGVDGNPAR